MIRRDVLLNDGSERLTAEELTLRIDRKGVTATGFFEHAKASERPFKSSVWVLVTMDDHQVLGEKPTVAVFATERIAKKAMGVWIANDCEAMQIEPSCVEYSPEGCFAYTKDGRLSWEIMETEVEETV